MRAGPLALALLAAPGLLIARLPERAGALAGRARVVAWRGDLDRAEQLWRAALERYPDAAELLIGLAQTLYWKGQPVLAETYAARARTVAPGDRAVRDLERVVRAALRPEIATNVDGANDSDNNDFVSQEGTVAGSLGDDLRGTLRVGWRRATDPRHRGTSYGGGGSVIAALGKGAVLRAGLGVRHIEPDTVSSTPLTAELGIGLRPGRYTAVSFAYTRSAFDETVGLMRQGLTVDVGDLSLDVSPAPGWSITGPGPSASRCHGPGVRTTRSRSSARSPTVLRRRRPRGCGARRSGTAHSACASGRGFSPPG